MSSIVIVDYGMGNLRSVQKAFETIGYSASIEQHPEKIAAADRLILPGVGAFQDAIAHITESGISEVLHTHIQRGRPFLGICLGLQLLFETGYEDGTHRGLGFLPGEVVRFDPHPGLKIPHMGWNSINTVPDCPLFHDIPLGSHFYFVHSYYARPTEPNVVAATADYPTPFCAAIWRDNLLATQFHPEKSQQVGLRLLENFMKKI
ncbi:MAG: imidazole glycerol phosphate synthase subunit HisH [Zavarzinella sp.]